MTKYQKIVIFMMLLGYAGLCSCSLFRSHPQESLEQSPLREFFPIQPEALYTYQVNMDNQNVERLLKWEGTENKGGSTVYFFTDGKGFTKAYEFTPEAVLLKGISLMDESQPLYYKGENPCLKLPLSIGNEWTIDATVKTQTTTIHQTGWARIVRREKCEVKAGIFDSVKVLFNVTSDYHVASTDEKSLVTSQFALWYGKDVGLLKQQGSAFLEKENRVLNLYQELIKYERRKTP